MRTLHKSPACATVRGAPNTYLAAWRIAATAVAVTDNGLHLGIDVVRVTRRDGNVHSTRLSAGGGVNKRGAAPSIHGCPSRIGAAGYLIAKHKSVIVPCDRGKISWATARRHRAAGSDDARNAAAHVCQLQGCYVLALGIEVISRTWASPVGAAVIRKVESLFGAGCDFIAVVRINAHFANCVVLRELAWRLSIGYTENVGSEDSPRGARVGGFENALATH